MTTLRRYYVRDKTVGWGVFVLDLQSGYFSVVSDYGNYAYIWPDTGMEFRRFLVKLDDDYLGGKLLSGRESRTQLDGEATKVAITERLEALNAAQKELTGRPWDLYEQEKELLEEVGGFDTEYEVFAWHSQTHLEDAHDYIVRRRDRQCVMFCTRLYPLFVEMLKEELEKEAHEKEDPAGARSAWRSCIERTEPGSGESCRQEAHRGGGCSLPGV